MTGSAQNVPGSVRYASFALVLIAALALFATRASAPHNFLDKDQERPASYILDAVNNGHWVCQTDWMGDITSKPPLLTWVGAGIATIAGGVSALVLYLPSALAMTLLALLIWRFGNHYFGAVAAAFAGIILLLSPLSMRLFILLRTDSVFALMVGLTAFAAYRASTRGKGWTLFWLLAALATLTKGPLGLLLGAGGLLVVPWERNSADKPSLKGNHLAGILLYIALTLGWFFLAYLQFGDALVDKIIRRELVAHAVNIGEADPIYERFFKPAIYYIHRVLPWSLVAFAAFWRVLRQPSTDPDERRFERFLFCWFFVGLGVFSVTQHQRGDLLAPILAPAALLAGRELATWLRRLRPAHALAVAAAAATLSVGYGYYYYHHDEAENPLVVDTMHLKHFADSIRAQTGPDYPFIYTDCYYTFQLYMGSMRTNVTFESAADTLASEHPAFTVTSESAAETIQRLAESRGATVYLIDQCRGESGTLATILGNRPSLPETR